MKENIERLKNVVSWLNETFIPLGIKPIETLELPKACPQVGNKCVIAVLLEKQNPKWSNDVSVGMTRIQIGYQTNIAECLEFDVPPEIAEFIRDYDAYKYPSLIDMDLIQEHYRNDPDAQRDIFNQMKSAGIDVGTRIEELEDGDI